MESNSLASKRSPSRYWLWSVSPLVWQHVRGKGIFKYSSLFFSRNHFFFLPKYKILFSTFHFLGCLDCYLGILLIYNYSYLFFVYLTGKTVDEGKRTHLVKALNACFVFQEKKIKYYFKSKSISKEEPTFSS